MIRHSATVSPQSRHRAAGALFPPAPTPVLPPCPHSFERVNKACLRFRYLFDPILFTSRKENLFVEQFEHSHHTDEKFRQIFQRVSFFGVFFFFFHPSPVYFVHSSSCRIWTAWFGRGKMCANRFGFRCTQLEWISALSNQENFVTGKIDAFYPPVTLQNFSLLFRSILACFKFWLVVTPIS